MNKIVIVFLFVLLLYFNYDYGIIDIIVLYMVILTYGTLFCFFVDIICMDHLVKDKFPNIILPQRKKQTKETNKFNWLKTIHTSLNIPILLSWWNRPKRRNINGNFIRISHLLFATIVDQCCTALPIRVSNVQVRKTKSIKKKINLLFYKLWTKLDLSN